MRLLGCLGDSITSLTVVPERGEREGRGGERGEKKREEKREEREEKRGEVEREKSSISPDW